MQTSLSSLESACRAAIPAVGNWEWDFASGALTWSGGLWELLNVEPSSAPSFELFLSRVHVGDRSSVELAIEEAQHSGRMIDIHFRLVTGEGSVRWLAKTGEVFRSPSGTPSWAAGAIFDFTELRETQHTIERRELHYRTLAIADSLGEWTATPQGRITRTSFWRAFTGRKPRQDLRPLTWTEAIHPDDRMHVAALWQETLRLGCASELTFRLLHRSGEFRWVHVKAVPIRAKSGELVEWLGSAKDVHAARQAEEELRISEKRMRLALSAAHMVTWDYNLSTGFVRRSENSADLLGISSCHINELASWVHPDDVSVVLASLQRTADTGQEHHLEYRLLLPGQGAARWIRACGKLHRGGLTGADRIIGLSIDISEQKRVEAEAARALTELKLTKRRLEALLRASGDITWTASPDGQVDDMPSWRAFTGQSLEDVRGWGWMFALHPADRERVRASIQAQLQSTSCGEIEYRIRQHNGSYEWFVTRAAPVIGEGGEPIEWIGTCSRMRAAPSELSSAIWGDPSPADGSAVISGFQVRGARALLRWSVQDLSNRSGVSISTIRRIEDQAGPCENREKRVIEKIRNTFEAAGVCFGLLAGGGSGVGLNCEY